MSQFNPIEISEEEYLEHTESYDGICLHCGEWSFGGCEPDARNYECESCGLKKVMGAEMALVAGHLDIV